MLAKIEDLKARFVKVDNVNRERIRVKIEKDNQLNELYNLRDKYREDIETARFTIRTSAEYYKIARENNLSELAEIVSEFMESVLDKEYEVHLGIKRNGNFDYLDATINGLEPKDLSGGEKQIYSLAMLSESVGNDVVVLDETINSLDEIASKKVIYYLEKMAERKQVFIIELNGHLEIPYTFMVRDNNILKEDANDDI